MLLPDAGDIAWVEFDPVRGTEQAGRRPALVLSSRSYHEQSRRAVVCPITSRPHAWPFNVALPANLMTKGVILVDQIRSIDREGRLFAIIERVPDAILGDVQGRLAVLVGIDLARIDPL
ncbi:MAG: type II toxin-antitoxin system PemK/MazF family toxin [Pseudolabrys sp.]|nr:type II toxin-antitoxin system PemK/MazF family toxin [Pseudolabrys sp.]